MRLLVNPTQDGNDDENSFSAVAARPDGSILLAGWTGGAWTTSAKSDDWIDYAAILLNVSVLSTTPTPNPKPLCTNSTPTASPVPSSIEPTTPSSILSVSFFVGGVVGLAVAAIFGIIVYIVRRRSRGGLGTVTTTLNIVPSRHFPAAAPSADGAVRSVRGARALRL